jgi:hypothetical protein
MSFPRLRFGLVWRKRELVYLSFPTGTGQLTVNHWLIGRNPLPDEKLGSLFGPA